MVEVTPDFKKKGKRIVDSGAVASKLLIEPWCRICGDRAGSAHHLVGRRRVDDSADIVVPLCGSGTTKCHGEIEKRDPVRSRRLGERLHPREMQAVTANLGDAEGRAYLERRYFVDYHDQRYEQAVAVKQAIL